MYFIIAFFVVYLRQFGPGCRKVDRFWLSAENRRKRSPSAYLSENKKEEGSRKSLRVCLACLGYSAWLR